MRYKTYIRKMAGFAPETYTFAEHHYQEAHVAFTPAAGMPILEAHQLVNKWNKDQNRFVYILD